MSEPIEVTRDTVTDYAIDGATGRMYVIERTRYRDAEGRVLTESLHRRPIEPDADVAEESEEVQRLAEIVRTPERVRPQEPEPR